MKIDRKEVEHVAQLARLRFDGTELDMFIDQLNTILDYFDKLQEVDTGNCEPTSHAVILNNVLRSDEAKDFSDKTHLRINAPSQERECFKVPKVIE